MSTTHDTTRNESNTINTLVLIVKTWFAIMYEMILSIYRLIVPVPEKSVKGEVVLITGAGHGIGKELALQFASLGATVVCWDINKESNEQTVTEISAAGYPKAYAYVCDISNRQTVLDVAERVQSEVGNVSVLVNNAGIMPCRPFLKHTDQDIRSVFEINVMSHFWTLEAFLPNMLENNHGHVIALSSMAGIAGIRNLVPYCASKFAVRGLMESLREELRETIRNTNVNFTTIYPYMVDTGLCKNPHSRFPSIFAPVATDLAARKIISAVRRNMKELAIPEYFMYINTTVRNFPENVAILVKDFMECFVEPDL
ncbi:Lipid droplet subset dehydrogenase 1 [Carabus blaptoides fortunei]